MKSGKEANRQFYLEILDIVDVKLPGGTFPLGSAKIKNSVHFFVRKFRECHVFGSAKLNMTSLILMGSTLNLDNFLKGIVDGFNNLIKK